MGVSDPLTTNPHQGILKLTSCHGLSKTYNKVMWTIAIMIYSIINFAEWCVIVFHMPACVCTSYVNQSISVLAIWSIERRDINDPGYLTA